MAEAVAQGRMVIEVDPSAIVDSAWRDRHVETLADPAFLELQDSVVRNGQLVPVGLRRRSEGEDVYEIVYGHRRVSVARARGLKVKAVLINGDDRRLISAMLVENAARKDLSPVERGRAYRRILDAGLYDRQELGSILGVSAQQISNLTRLADIPDQVLELIGDWRTLSINEGQRLAAALTASGGVVPGELAHRVRTSKLAVAARARMLTNGLKDGRGIAVERSGIVLRAHDGRRLARLSRSGRQLVLRFQPDLDADRIERLAKRLADLWTELDARHEDHS
jgi:ParB family chromosome partitioning protein